MFGVLRALRVPGLPSALSGLYRSRERVKVGGVSEAHRSVVPGFQPESESGTYGHGWIGCLGSSPSIAWNASTISCAMALEEKMYVADTSAKEMWNSRAIASMPSASVCGGGRTAKSQRPSKGEPGVVHTSHPWDKMGTRKRVGGRRAVP